jgi:hypothetical protein
MKTTLSEKSRREALLKLYFQYIFCLLFSKQEKMLFKLELERFYRESEHSASMWPSFRAHRPLRERKKQDLVTPAALINIDLGIFPTVLSIVSFSNSLLILT